MTNVLQLWAYDFEVNGIYYNYIQGTDNEVEVTYKGNNYYDLITYYGEIIIPSVVFYSDSSYKVTRIGNYAFYFSTISSIEIPIGVKSVGENAFVGCTYLTTIDIPNSVTNIEENAFNSCSFTSINIPASINNIGESAFINCLNLSSITVDEENIAYSSKEGVLFNKTQTNLICFPAGKAGTYYIPENVKEIGDYSFLRCYKLTAITIPNSVISIGYSAFSDCPELTSIAIPKSVENIGSYAFSQCTGLKSITVEWDIPIGIDDQFCVATDDPFCKNIASSCLLIVPRGSEVLYRNASGWQNFKIIISDIYIYSYENTLSFTSNKTDSINIHSNISWTTFCDANWITVSPKSGNGDTKLMVSVSANNSINPRFSKIIVSGEGVEDWIIKVSQQAGYSPGWEYVRSVDNNGKANDTINKVYAQGENNVYLVGEKGYIAKSTDNALTWNKQNYPTQETMNDIVFCNDELGFVVGNNGTILRTEDAGENWTQLNSGTAQNINAIAATSENNIWVVGNGGLIMQSIDAGENWIIRNYTDNRNLYDIKFKNDTGYIVGDRNEVICVQNRKGLPPYWWLQSAYTNPDEYDKITSLNITDSKVYTLVKRGGYGNDMVVYTSDNENWSVFSLNSDGYFPPIMAITQIFFQNDSVVYFTYIPFPTTGIAIYGYPFVLMETSDGGKTWNYQELPRLYSFIGRYSDKVDFSSSKDNEYGYLASGTALLRTPYTGDFYMGLPNIKFDESNLILKQQGNYLQVSADSRTIASVEIISVAGVRLLQVNKTEIDISSFSRGIYLIHALFTDKTSETVKWVKH